MKKPEIQAQIMEAFPPHGELPDRFTEHGPECIECEEVNIQIQKFAQKLKNNGVVVRHPGPDLLYLNCIGLKYLFPYLASYVLGNEGGDRDELATDLVESYLDTVISKDRECFSKQQLYTICNFALWCIEAYREEILDYGSTEKELDTLSRMWKSFA